MRGADHGDVAIRNVGEVDARSVEDAERVTLVDSEYSAFQRKNREVVAVTPPTELDGFGFKVWD